MTTIDLDSITWPQSIRGINGLERPVKRAMYLTIIPVEIFERFGIDRDDPERVRVICPHDTRSFEVYLFRDIQDRDPVLYLHMADTLNNQIAVLLLVINDVDGPRFDVDVDEKGSPTRFGTLRRNIPEELRALEAGLSPGQIHRGLRISERTLPRFEEFLARTGHDMVIIEPLTYNNATLYERYGFSYFQGRQRMEWINRVLRPGGEFFERLDGSTPFRSQDAWQSIRRRAWAIHDGILGEPFGDIRMYKRIGHHAGINTFPDGVW